MVCHHRSFAGRFFVFLLLTKFCDSGAFSVVKEVTSKRSGRRYAVKIIDKKNVGQDMQRLRVEIDILTRVKHPNIINLKEIMEDDDTLYIITEL